jgi:hypothetical protein
MRNKDAYLAMRKYINIMMMFGKSHTAIIPSIRTSVGHDTNAYFEIVIFTIE